MHRKVSLIALMAMFSLASISAFGQGGDKTKVKGMINSRTGETFIVQTDKGNVTVILTDSTKTKDNKGLLGLRGEKAAHDALMPGLKVDIDGTFDTQGHVLATGITVDGDDLETSQMIQAGLMPTAKRIDALERRLAAVEALGSHAATPAPDHATSPDTAATTDTAATADHAPAQAASPSPATTAPAAEPGSGSSEASKTGVNMVWVGLALLVVIACSIGFFALKRAK